MPNYLTEFLRADDVPRFVDCVHFHGERVYFTPLGVRRYRERFARAGFDIAQIETAEDLQCAIEGSWHIELECFMAAVEERWSGLPNRDRLEEALLRATTLGDDAERQRLEKVLERRNRLKLRVVR
jgi:hypothetical protein